MSRLYELIAKLCPDGVEYKQLKEIASVSIGEFVHKSKQNPNGAYPVYNGGIVNTGFYNETNRTANKIIISARGANAGFVNRVFVDFWAGNSCYTISIESQNIDWNYVYYFLKNSENKLINEQQKGGIPAVSKKQVEEFKIPLPPLPVQQEIVRILDKYTELSTKFISNLSAELTARKKQYEFYRDLLLSFGEEVPRVKLKDIATDMYRGSGIKRDEITEDGTPCVRYGEIYTTYNIWFDSCVSHTRKGTKTFEHGDILFAITGESVEEIAKSCAYMGHEKCFAGGDVVVMKHNQNPKYLAYALSTYDAQTQKSEGKVKNKVVHSSIPALKEIQIPLPPLDEQARIVSILDKFYELTINITNLLPAEIEARQKQYEYYRDKLLSFKEVSA